jgi:hypothetical protein
MGPSFGKSMILAIYFILIGAAATLQEKFGIGCHNELKNKRILAILHQLKTYSSLFHDTLL